MTFDSKNIEQIYAGNVARKYDLPMAHFFARFKKLTYNASLLQTGDRVLVFCCGTGLDFPHILKKIGKEGKIVGVDFSTEMLKQAWEKIDKHSLENIELIEADITKTIDQLDGEFDVGACTLGMSIIPDYKAAYSNLAANVKPGGEIIIGDMQLASGWLASFNPLTLALAKRYGGSPEGHKNSLELRATMERELTDIRKREFFFGSYFYCIGRTG
jgi:demethylmenaquinone methyltransferase/2-methoxy-6-polyprenyl-1,4-benzoquinol methylase